VIQIREDLASRIATLERELKIVLERQEEAFRYRWAKGLATFESEVLSEHLKLKWGLVSYVLHARILAL